MFNFYKLNDKIRKNNNFNDEPYLLNSKSELNILLDTKNEPLNKSLNDIHFNIDEIYKSLDFVHKKFSQKLNNNFINSLKNKERKNNLLKVMEKYNRIKSNNNVKKNETKENELDTYNNEENENEFSFNSELKKYEKKNNLEKLAKENNIIDNNYKNNINDYIPKKEKLENSNDTNIFNNSINININNDKYNHDKIKEPTQYFKKINKPGFFVRKVVREEHYYVDENGKEKILRVKQEYMNNEDKKILKRPYKKKFLNLGAFLNNNHNNSTFNNSLLKEKENDIIKVKNHYVNSGNTLELGQKNLVENHTEPIFIQLNKDLNKVDFDNDFNDKYITENAFENRPKFQTLVNYYEPKNQKIKKIKKIGKGKEQNDKTKETNKKEKPNLVDNPRYLETNNKSINNIEGNLELRDEEQMNIGIKNIRYIKVNKTEKPKNNDKEMKIKKKNTGINIGTNTEVNKDKYKRKRESSKNHAYHEIKITQKKNNKISTNSLKYLIKEENYNNNIKMNNQHDFLTDRNNLNNNSIFFNYRNGYLLNNIYKRDYMNNSTNRDHHRFYESKSSKKNKNFCTIYNEINKREYDINKKDRSINIQIMNKNNDKNNHKYNLKTEKIFNKTIQYFH